MPQTDLTFFQQLLVADLVCVWQEAHGVAQRMESSHSPGQLGDDSISRLPNLASLCWKHEQDNCQIHDWIAKMHISPVDHAGKTSAFFDDQMSRVQIAVDQNVSAWPVIL